MLRRLLASALIFVASVAQAAPPAIPPGPPTSANSPIVISPNAVQTTLGAALSRAQGPIWRAVSRQAQFGGFFGPNNTPGYRTGFTDRVWEQIPSGASVVAIRLVYSGYYSQVSLVPAASGSAGEAPGINPVTCTASIETNTTPSLTSWSSPNGTQIISPPVTFGGSASFTLPITGIIKSDPIYIYMPGGTPYYVRTYCNEPVAGKIPIRRFANGNSTGTNIGYLGATFGTGDGSTTSFNYTAPAAYQPIVAGSVTFAVPGFSNSTDNGSGGCTAANGVSSCTINYTSGTINIVTSAAVASGQNITGWLTGGASNGDQTQASGLTNFATSTNQFSNPIIGPVSIEGLSLDGALHAVGIFGDSIDEGIGNSTGFTDTSWADYCADGLFGVIKAAISGEQLVTLSDQRGRIGRLAIFSGSIDRIIENAATNDIVNGKSLSQLINYFLLAQPALSGAIPSGSSGLWWASMLPRTNSSSVPIVPSSGPYTAASVAYGSGAVVNPTPLGGTYNSGSIGSGVQKCVVTGNGTTGPYACSFGAATMIGSLWSDGALTTIVDTGSGGTGATTLTGSGISTGTHTPSTGAVSITMSSALTSGKTINLYAYLSGPSARNAWNYFLYNWAVPLGKIKGVIDLASCVETTPNSSQGAGNGTWANASWTADYTHPSATGHQTIIPGCIGPSGTSPSLVWTFN